jgi:hypothetical protein
MMVLSHTAAAAAHVLEAASRAVLFMGAVWAREDFNVLRHVWEIVGVVGLVMVALWGAASVLDACAMEAAGRAVICASAADGC